MLGHFSEELHPVGRTQVGEVHGELSRMGGTSRWSRKECEESSSLRRKEWQRQSVMN